MRLQLHISPCSLTQGPEQAIIPSVKIMVMVSASELNELLFLQDAKISKSSFFEELRGKERSSLPKVLFLSSCAGDGH